MRTHMDNRDDLECGHSWNRVAEGDIILFPKGSGYVILKDKEPAIHYFSDGPLWTRPTRRMGSRLSWLWAIE
jgi:hypothetical protein